VLTVDTIFKRLPRFVAQEAHTVFNNVKLYKNTRTGVGATLFLAFLSLLFSALFFTNVNIKTVLADKNPIQVTDSDLSVSEAPRFLVSALFDGNKMKELKQDFTWGVLAVNFDKSSYEVGEDVNVEMAVLNDGGHTLCDSKLTMEITAPDSQKTTLSTDDGSIKISKWCADKSVTDTPDYYASYKTPLEGKYQVHLTAETKNGARSIDDSFSVEKNADFVIKRAGSMRIYPPSHYTARSIVYANKDVSGIVTEKVPKSFEISGISGDGRVTKEDSSTKTISWPLNLKKGESREVSYTYDAPDISPEFYLLGPAQIVQDNKVIFEESRQWQIASDPSISIAGTSDATAGNTIKVAVNGTLQGKTTTVGATWTITGLMANTGDVITVWIDSATVAEQSTAVTKYNGTNITGMVLNKHVLTIGSNQNQSLSVTDMGLYDHDNNATIMHTANLSVLNIDAAGYPTGTYTDELLSVLASNTLTFGTTETLNTLNLTNAGTITCTGNTTLNVYGNWANSGTFTPSTSTVAFQLSSGTQTLNSGGTGAGKPFNNIAHSGAGLLQLITNNISISGALTNSSGAGNYDANAYTTTVTGLTTVSGGSYLASTTTQTFNGGLTINGGTFTGSIGAVSVSSSTATAMTLSSGTLTAPSGTFTIIGNWVAIGGTFTPGTNTVTFGATSGTQTIRHDISPGFYNLTHNAAGTLQISNTSTSTALTVTNDFTNSAGAFDTKSGSNYPVSVTRDYIQSGGQATAQSSTITVGRNFTADGTTSITGYNSASVILNGAGNLVYNNLSTPWSNGFYNLTCGQNGYKTNLNGSNQNIGILHNLTIGSGGITETADYWTAISISGIGNALTVDATNSSVAIGTLKFYGNGVVSLPYLVKGYNTGILVAGDNAQVSQTGDITIKNYPAAGGIYNAGVRIIGDNVSGRVSSWITNGYGLTMWGDLELGVASDTGGKTLDITNSNVNIGGSFKIYASTETFTATGSTVTANGASGTQQYQTQGKPFNNLVHNATGTLQLLTNNLSVGGTFTNSAGTYDANALTTTVTGLATVSGGTYSASTNTQTFNGGLTVSGGTFTGGSGTVNATNVTISSGTLTAPSTNLNISGNLSNSGTFTHNSGTVTFNGAGISTITGSATAPSFAVTFNNLTVSAGKTVKFGNGKYFKVLNSMALNGTLGSHVTVTSVDGLNKWYINHQGTETISYVDIDHSGCDYTNSPNTTDVTMTGTNSTNNGNIEGCWVFPSNPNLPSSLAQKTSPDGVSIPESAAEADFTPDLGFTISDPDAGNTVKYEIQVATNSAFTAPIIDYTHGSLSANPTTFTFTIGSYGSGTCAGSCPSTLSDLTGYWWRVKAIDNSGTSSAWVEFGVAGTMDIYVDSTAMIGGSLSMTAMTVGDFAGTTLSGAATTNTATPSNFSVTDARGTGAGWNITVQATQFKEWDGTAYVTGGKTLAVSSLSMPAPTVAANGTTSPVPSILAGPYTIDTGAAVKISSAVLNTGMGRYDYTQDPAGLTLSIPANTYATLYRSEVTVSAVSGP